MHSRKIAVIGLGYVGLPVAVAFGKQSAVVGFDINAERIQNLNNGYDETNEYSPEDLKDTDIQYTTDIEQLKKADFFIITVPTPITKAKQPDLRPLIKASETIASALKKGDVVVYESTVYPGTTEEKCIPVLEKLTGLKAGTDFGVGYSPERINPGDKEHTFTNILKIVSGLTPHDLDTIADTYLSVVTAGVHKSPSIKVAEAAKVIENTQRDLNIALMNELTIIFDRMGISVYDVLDAAGTKWNFLPFKPGLVGGHCIGVDPYYLTHKAQKVGYNPEVILAGRRINDNMSIFIAQKIIKTMILEGLQVKGAKVGVYGITFKENCPDTRNSKVFDMIEELESYGIEIVAFDPVAKQNKHVKFPLKTLNKRTMNELVALIVAVPHNELKELELELLASGQNELHVFDIKNVISEVSHQHTKVHKF